MSDTTGTTPNPVQTTEEVKLTPIKVVHAIYSKSEETIKDVLLVMAQAAQRTFFDRSGLSVYADYKNYAPAAEEPSYRGEFSFIIEDAKGHTQEALQHVANLFVQSGQEARTTLTELFPSVTGFYVFRDVPTAEEMGEIAQLREQRRQEMSEAKELVNDLLGMLDALALEGVANQAARRSSFLS